ncbi:glycosyltransferase [Reichenbachiella agarivorans]|uniref:Glycosyltransferase n=1 Tax=Reichenbachiella agarivorans TaxID=2979464 RepID=A0ABY6CRC8_9BACT|nr:glycosyltransferase [Reichenbachiella agarivorans]UXP33062.1 glycosyltransferase [Reichenbachiella agarivorans]
MIKYSVIVPVYNRPHEMKELLDSMAVQTRKDIEIIVVEDGSTDRCDHLMSGYDLNIDYFYKPNTGPGDSRNFGMTKAKGDYLLFFDSDCLLPEDYFEQLDRGIAHQQPDAFGGPDAAHASFSDVQKAINYAMTSFLTTGGIRGGKKQLDKYQPRSFNMGISKEVYARVGGFSDIHPGEDPDLSFRIMEQGFKVVLIPQAKVFHKRRIDFSKFLKQVYKFGVVRVILNKWYPATKKTVYFLPSLFFIGVSLTVLLAVCYRVVFFLPLILYSVLLLVDAIRLGNSLKVSLMAIPAAWIQLLAYGFGFLKSMWKLHVLGLPERKAFPSFFFDKKKP